MKRTFILFGLLLSVAGLPDARGQSITPSILNATGGTATLSGGNTVEWSIGEMTMVSTFSSPSVIVTQGVLQPKDGTGTGISSVALTHDLVVFPNPANSIVNLKYTSASAGILTYKLMDITGRMVLTNTAEIKQGVTTEQMNISNLAAATYMLEVIFKADGAQEEMATYKIDKLK